jgi:ELWxxDGT repeat protein
VGNTLYFPATDAAGSELWKTNGTAAGTVMVKDIASGSGSSTPRNFVAANGLVFFAALDAAGVELWKTDGTEAGTLRVRDISPGFSLRRMPAPLASST